MLDLSHLHLPTKPCLRRKPSTGVKGPNSAFGEQVEAVCEMMGDKRFAYWCGRLRRFKDNPERIYDLLKEARTSETPARLFNYLLKKSLTPKR